jgi:hypothetical protein
MPRPRANAVPQCTVCKHRQRKAVEVALRGGTSLRQIRRLYGLSPQALLRHRDRHMRPPPVVQSSAMALYERMDGAGGSSPPSGGQPAATTLDGPARAVGHPTRWWGPDKPRPGLGVRCEVCRGNEFWDVANWWGGCSHCWSPTITDGRKRTFTTCRSRVGS